MSAGYLYPIAERIGGKTLTRLIHSVRQRILFAFRIVDEFAAGIVIAGIVELLLFLLLSPAHPEQLSKHPRWGRAERVSFSSEIPQPLS